MKPKRSIKGSGAGEDVVVKQKRSIKGSGAVEDVVVKPKTVNKRELSR